MPTELPAGRYLSCAFALPPHAGGQTRALLMRNRILAREGGVRPELLTLGAVPDHAERCERLREQGLLDGIPITNIFEHYRDRGWGEAERTGELDDLGAHLIREDRTPAGVPWRTVYRPDPAKRPTYDYLRPDGTPFLRMRRFSKGKKWSWPDSIQRVGTDGAVLGEFDSLGQWFRAWIRELLGDEPRAFVFVDSRFVVPHLVPMRGPRMHLIYTMHNIHVQPPRRWDSDSHRVYERVLRRIGGMDAMVTLTERQREDIALRRGSTSNMFVVPNPVVMPEPPAERRPRDPNQVTIVARLEKQKRLEDAIAAFEQVRAALPEARLDIFGDGAERDALQAEIDARGLAGAVVLRGFDPRASDTLWTSSAFLMTSAFEGYPLSTLESMSRGCPVVSYDIKYGPREQVSDGSDGFLIPAGDTALLAQRLIELLSSPELVERMSAAARAKAERFGPRESVATWARVLETTVEHKPLRTRVDGARFELTGLEPLGRVGRRLRRRSPRARRIEGTLEVDGQGAKAGWDSARVELEWIDRDSGAVTAVPARVKRTQKTFRVRATLDPPAGRARLRLRLTWRNSAWQTEVVRVRGGKIRRPG